MEKQKKELLKLKDIGAVGIGAMIVFISMVLVAGIAASVLIQTSGSLEMRAMQAGTETTAEVATGIQVERVHGYYDASESRITLLAIEIRCRSGSNQIDLSETVIELTDSLKKNYLTYENSNYTNVSTIGADIFTHSFFPLNNSTVFGIIVLEDADNSVTRNNPVINAGDHVILTVNVSSAFGGLPTRTLIRGLVIPEFGSPGVISFSTPPAFTNPVVELQ